MDVIVFVEVPSGSRNTYELDAATGQDLEAEKTETRGFGNRADAERVIAAARDRAG